AASMVVPGEALAAPAANDTSPARRSALGPAPSPRSVGDRVVSPTARGSRTASTDPAPGRAVSASATGGPMASAKLSVAGPASANAVPRSKNAGSIGRPHRLVHPAAPRRAKEAEEFVMQRGSPDAAVDIRMFSAALWTTSCCGHLPDQPPGAVRPGSGGASVPS